MKIKNYTTMNLSETFCSLRTTATVLLLGGFLLTNNTVNAQNNALDFDGVNDYVSLPATINNQITTNNVTVEGWFNMEAIDAEVTLIGEWYDNADTNLKFALYHATSTNIVASFSNDGVNFPFVAFDRPALNTWVHFAATYDGINLRLYYDGVQVAVQSETGSLPATGNGLWALGKRTDAPGQFKGKMDEVRIWNTTRTPEEILANYKKQVADNSAGLIAYYKMNQGVAEANNTAITSLTNSSSVVSLNGTFNGFALTGTSSNFVTGIPTVYNAGWSQGTPDATTNAIIEGNYNVAGNFSAKTLTVTNSAEVTIPSGTNVTVAGAVTVTAPATFTLSNNANLIQLSDATNIGAITVNRVSNTLKRLDYTAWSSPVTGTQTLLDFSPLTLANRFYEFGPLLGTNGQYSVITSPSTQTFTAGKGYLIRMPDNLPLAGYNDGSASLAYPGSFTGVPHNGNISAVLSSNGGENSYNLVGNPYPSVINAQDFLNVNNVLNNRIGGTLYFWRKENGIGTAYATYTMAGGVGTAASTSSEVPNDFIQVGQGFLVKSSSASSQTYSDFFTNDMRELFPTSTQFFKTIKEAQKDRVWLNLTTTTGVFSQALVAYIADATAGLDRYDGKYFNDSPIALTSNINNQEYTIQGRPAFDTTDVVALNFKTDVAGDYTIAIDHSEGVFATGQDVYLVDNTTGIETDLKAGAYNFKAVAGVDNSRFSLKYQKTLKVDATEFNENSVSVYAKDGIVFVNSGKIAINSIQVYDVQGRLIAERRNVKASTATLDNLKASNQVLLVKISGANNEEVTKKVLN